MSRGPLSPTSSLPHPLARICSFSESGVMLQTVVSHRQPNTEVLLLTQLLLKQQQTIFITQVRSNHPPGHPASIPATQTGPKASHFAHSALTTLGFILPLSGILDKALPLIPLEPDLLHGCQDCQRNREDTSIDAV
jgi:hypothetical protein